MTDDPHSPRVLLSLATEVEAVSIVTALADRDIEATSAQGGSFPGTLGLDCAVQVIVKNADFDRARRALAEIQAELADIDWSKVDVDDAEASGPPAN